MPSARSPRPSDIAAIEAALTVLVRRARLPDAHAAAAAAAGVRLDRASYVVLSRIGEWGPIRLSELAGRLGVDVSTASRHVHRLVTDGYITRADDPTDRRAALLSLTEPGTEAVDRIRAARRDALGRLLDDWPADDRAALARLLSRLAESLTAGETP